MIGDWPAVGGRDVDRIYSVDVRYQRKDQGRQNRLTIGLNQKYVYWPVIERKPLVTVLTGSLYTGSYLLITYGYN